MSEKVERIDCFKDGVDDVAIGPVEIFRLERMSPSSFWCCAYVEGKRHVFWIHSARKITVTHDVEDMSK